MYGTRMNERNLAKKLHPKVFLLFLLETGEEGWGRVTGTLKNHTPSLLLAAENIQLQTKLCLHFSSLRHY